jgi:hypothetical protein
MKPLVRGPPPARIPAMATLKEHKDNAEAFRNRLEQLKESL